MRQATTINNFMKIYSQGTSEVFGIADLFKSVRHFHPVSLRFYDPEAIVRLPKWKCLTITSGKHA